MNITLVRPLLVGFNPASDRKWLPEGMAPCTLYPVIGYENGVIKRKDQSTGEALYFHFVGNLHRPCRLLASNAVIVEAQGDEHRLPGGGAALWDEYIGADMRAAPGPGTGNAAAPASA